MDGSADAAMIDPQTDIADLFVKLESYERLYAALEQLSVVQRRRLRLYFVHNLTHRQIAELEGVDQSAIGYSIKRAIKQLQKYITD